MRQSPLRAAAGSPAAAAPSRAHPAGAPRRRWVAPALLAAVVVARLLLTRALGLFNDEAYYWEWSRHLAASYFDHAPAVAYAIAASTRLLGRSALAVHLPAGVFALLTSAVLYRLALDLFPGRERVAWWAVAASNAAPLFGIGAVFTTPDAPYTFFCLLATWLTWRATHGAPRAWYLAGAAVGAGLLSKYTTVLMPLGVAAYLALPANRRWWRRREPWLAAAIALALAAPVLAWNAEHGWASLSFQVVERVGAWQPLPKLRRFLVAQQAISPLLWLLCAAALARSVALARRGSDAHAFLACGALAVLGVFAAFAPWAWVNPNWTAMAYLLAFVAAADLVDGRGWAVRVLPVAVAAASTAILYAQGLWLPFPTTGRGDMAGDLQGWEEAAARARALRDAMPDPGRTFVYASRFQQAALLAFHAGDEVPVTRLGGARRDAYDAWRDDLALRGRDAVFVSDDWNPAAPDARFRACERAGELPVVRRDRRIRTFSFWRCWSYAP
jgi:hypothetical protein